MLITRKHIHPTWSLLAVFLTVVLASPRTEAQIQYSYRDTYSTDKAMWDSYWHSPFVDTLPDYYLYGLLMYSYVSDENRALGFYSGFEVESPAYLFYAFPLGGEQGIIAFGTMEITVWTDSTSTNRHLGLYISYDDGETWSFHDLGESGLHIFAMFPPSSCTQVLLKFVGGGIYGPEGPRLDNFNISLTIEDSTGIHEPESDGELPAEFVLFQNYPNPFNIETNISYHLPEESKVILEVYNITGQLIKRLIDGIQPAGCYSTCWDGNDSDGLPVASGLYFCRLQADGFFQTRKMLLIR